MSGLKTRTMQGEGERTLILTTTSIHTHFYRDGYSLSFKDYLPQPHGFSNYSQIMKVLKSLLVNKNALLP